MKDMQAKKKMRTEQERINEIFIRKKKVTKERMKIKKTKSELNANKKRVT